MKKRHIYAFPKINISRLFGKERVQYNFIFNDKNAVMLSSGRAAVYNGAKLLNLKQNDVVLVPAYHCGVEIEALIQAGVKIRYYRITLGMEVDKEDLKEKTDDSVRALFIIHYWGFPQDLSWIFQYCKLHGIFLIEDCAHAIYSKYHGNFLGTAGEVGIYSLPKTFAVPNGGILRFDGDRKGVCPEGSRSDLLALKAAIRSIMENMRNQSCNPFGPLARAILSLKKNTNERNHFGYSHYGENSMNRYKEKISFLSKYFLRHSDPEMIARRRRQNYSILLRKLLGSDSFEIPFKNLDEEVCPLFFPVIIEKRESLEQYLMQNHIATFVFGRNLHPSLCKEDYPESQFLSSHVLGLPIHQDLRGEDLERITRTIDTWRNLTP